MSEFIRELSKTYKTKTVLVIDDYPDMRGSIRRMIDGYNVKQVDTASTGEEAMQKCESTQYDIILADYNLGDGKNGQQILEELRFKNLLKHTSIYMMITAETTRTMVFSALEYQPDDYLTKPFTQAVLKKRLDRLILEKNALLKIHSAMDKKQFDVAIALCQQQINEPENKYKHRCYRLMGYCLYQIKQYEQAKQIYQGVLEERELDWASIGLGKCLIELNELDTAETIFQKLIQDDCLCLEIYDCLADIRNKQGDSEEAQQLLETAIDISPNAIVRQEQLAKISEDNHDWEQAEKSRRKILRIGNNSVYESPEHHFKLARTITSGMEELENPKNRLKDAEEILRRAKRKYKNDNNVALQSDILEANALAGAGEIEKSKAKVADIQERVEKSVSAPPELMLDMAQAYKSVGEEEKATTLLKDLAKNYEDNEEISGAIDRLSDEPLSKLGKQKAVELNKTGKELFSNKEYQKAIRLFSQALRHYPNNLGLNLNLMLALVREMSASGTDSKQLKRCELAKEKLLQMESDNPLYERYKVLCEHYEKLKATSED